MAEPALRLATQAPVQKQPDKSTKLQLLVELGRLGCFWTLTSLDLSGALENPAGGVRGFSTIPAVLHSAHGVPEHTGTSAGCASIGDDPFWQSQLLHYSTYFTMLLANPWLERLDVSRTKLSNAGLFYLLLEIATCDPERPGQSGCRHLKQLVIGPPASPQNCEAAPWRPFLAPAIADLVHRVPTLAVVVLCGIQEEDIPAAGFPGSSLPPEPAEGASAPSVIAALWQMQVGQRRARQSIYAELPALVLDCGCATLP